MTNLETMNGETMTSMELFFHAHAQAGGGWRWRWGWRWEWEGWPNSETTQHRHETLSVNETEEVPLSQRTAGPPAVDAYRKNVDDGTSRRVSALWTIIPVVAPQTGTSTT